MLDVSSRIHEELESIRAADPDGVLRTKVVHDWARDHPKSGVHKELEWDDAKAGYRYRLDQIRRLIAVHVVSEEGERQLVSLSIDRPKGGGYRPLDNVLANADLRRILLKDALDEFNRFQLKYQRVQQLAKVFEEGDRVKRNEERRKQREVGKAQPKRKVIRKR